MSVIEGLMPTLFPPGRCCTIWLEAVVGYLLVYGLFILVGAIDWS